MQTAEKKQADWAVLWQEERQTLSLQGEPVLEYALVRPQIRDGGRGGRRLDRYYQHLAEVWRRRWSRALYWHACLDLARCRERFDFVFVDPPYHCGQYGEILAALAPVLAPGGKVLVEGERDLPLEESYGLLLKQKSYRYGKTVVSLYQKGEE